MLPRALTLLLVLASCGRTEIARFDLDAGVVTVEAERDGGACPAGFALQSGRCVEVAASLSGLRWELPCLTLDRDFPEYVCFTHPEVTQTATLRGTPGRSYEVRVRVRGVVETRAYTGGTVEAPFIRRGGDSMPTDADAWNVYRLDVSAPAEHWFLNAGASGEYVCHAVDATFTLRAAADATVTLFASSVDGRRSQIRNRTEDGGVLVAAGVPPAPGAFDGQFLQLDVLSVSAAP